jgi:Protein of unknown function (DUF4238)
VRSSTPGRSFRCESASPSRGVSPSASLERPLVPRFLLAGFGDAAGQLMAERRDRTRRRLVSADAAVGELGGYMLPTEHADGPALARLFAEAEAGAADAVLRAIGGTFPPRGADRASLALVLAVQLLLGRFHRAAAARTAALVGQLIVATIEEAEAARAESSEEEDPDDAGTAEPPAVEPPDTRPAAAPEALLLGASASHSLTAVPLLARQLAARTWQLVRFPSRVLLTSDTPAVLWAPTAAAKPYQVGLGSAHEVRVPLDPRHALIVARHAQAGEIVRDLSERHARALNRTVAEAAAEWMYYHPESDPLEGVELPSPESD